jgi:hypothetical protein
MDRDSESLRAFFRQHTQIHGDSPSGSSVSPRVCKMRMTGRWPIRTLAHDDALVVMPFSLFVPPFYRERNADFWRYFILESPTSDNNTWRNQSKFCQEACFLRAARQCNPVAGRRKPNLRREPALSAPQLFHWFFQAPLQRCPSRIAGPPCLWRGSPADFRHTNGCVTPLPMFGKGSGSVGRS